jgi:hypothetical protein
MVAGMMTKIHETGNVRLYCGDDASGLMYAVYQGLDTLLYWGRSYREASKCYSQATRGK